MGVLNRPPKENIREATIMLDNTLRFFLINYDNVWYLVILMLAYPIQIIQSMGAIMLSVPHKFQQTFIDPIFLNHPEKCSRTGTQENWRISEELKNFTLTSVKREKIAYRSFATFK